jgi:hypothetical protein
MRLKFVLACALGVIALGGCGKRSAQQASESAPGSPSEPHSSSNGKQFVNGADQAAIRAYLESVHEVKPIKFDVEWSADTVPVSRDEVMRSLRAVSEDGSRYTFATSEPVVSKLQPGKIIWIWGIAIRRVDRIGTIDDTTLVHTIPVALSEAMTRADIELESPMDFGAAYGTYHGGAQPASASAPAPAVKTSRVRYASPFLPVRLEEPQPGAPPQDQAPPDGGTPDNIDNEDVVVGTADGYTGKIAGFEYSLAYNLTPGNLKLDLQARRLEEEGHPAAESHEIHRDQRDEYFEYVREAQKAEKEADEQYEREAELQKELSDIKAFQAGSPVPSDPKVSGLGKESLQALEKLDQIEEQKAMAKYQEKMKQVHADEAKAKALAQAGAIAKQVFYILSDNLDVRFRAQANINRQALLAAAIKIVSGSAAGSSINFKDLKGTIDLEFIGRLGREGGKGVNIPVAHLPVNYNIPVLVGGVPLVVQLAADFLVKLYLAGHHAAQHLTGHFEFSGSGGFTETMGKEANSNMNFTGSEPEVPEPEAESPGVSGTVWAVQLPRLGVGVGVWGAAAIGYIDQVTVLTITNNAAVATLNPPCKRYTLDRTGHVGGELSTLVPIPVIETLTRALSWKKEVWHAKQWVKVEPDIAMCHI